MPTPRPGFITPPPQPRDLSAQQETPSTTAEKKLETAATKNLIIGREIGSGAFGVVCEATLVITDKDGIACFPCVAKKEKKQSPVNETPEEFSISERLMRHETSSAKAGIAKPIGVIEQNGVSYSLYAPGICSLEDCKTAIADLYIKQTDIVLHQNLVLNFFDFMIRSLSQLQSGNTVHCDIKPANMVYRLHQEELKELSGLMLIDFGCATHNNYNPEEIEVRGTLLYIDPKILSTGRPEFSNDIYAMGVILNELIGKAEQIPRNINPFLFLCMKGNTYKKVRPKKHDPRGEKKPEDFYATLSIVVEKMLTGRADLSVIISAHKELGRNIEKKLPQQAINDFYLEQSERNNHTQRMLALESDSLLFMHASRMPPVATAAANSANNESGFFSSTSMPHADLTLQPRSSASTPQ